MNKTERRPAAPEGSLRATLASVPDVRRGQGKVHPLDRMLALAVCAQMCGCRSLYAISQWGRECEPEIREALGLRGIHGEEIPGVHLVAAVAHQTRVVLAQAETVGKGHELAGVATVLAELPARLLSGRVITGEALLANRARCRQLVRKGSPISSS
jgi:hypothetical protein